MVIDKHLHDKYIRAMVDTLTFLKSKLEEGEEIPLMNIEYPKFGEFMKFHEVKREPVMYMFFIHYFSDIEKLQSVRELLELMFAMPSILAQYEGRISSANKPIKPSEADPRFMKSMIYQEFFMPLVEKYIEKKELEFDETLFDDLYQDLESYLQDKKLRMRYMAVIYNLSSDADVIDLNGVRVRRAEGKEFGEIQGLGNMAMQFLSPTELQYIRYFMETDQEITKKKPVNNEDILNMFERILNIFRLYKTGHIDKGLLLIKPISIPFAHLFRMSFIPGTRPSSVYENYELKGSELEKFKNFYETLVAIQSETKGKHGYLNIAIDRFGSAVKELFVQDKLIDHMISLEALYLLERDELSYRLSLRASVLLSDGSDPEYIREFVKETYDARSSLVHGKPMDSIKVNSQNIQIQNVSSELERINRLSIKKFVNLSQHYDNQDLMLRDLDKSILDANLRKNLLHRSSVPLN